MLALVREMHASRVRCGIPTHKMSEYLISSRVKFVRVALFAITLQFTEPGVNLVAHSRRDVFLGIRHYGLFFPPCFLPDSLRVLGLGRRGASSARPRIITPTKMEIASSAVRKRASERASGEDNHLRVGLSDGVGPSDGRTRTRVGGGKDGS